MDASGLPPKTDFDLFVLQVPKAPFGVAWYQGDLETNHDGEAHGRFIGRFSSETFAVATGSAPAPVVFDGPFPDASLNPAFNPIQMYHLGLWFNSPADATFPVRWDVGERRSSTRPSMPTLPTTEPEA